MSEKNNRFLALPVKVQVEILRMEMADAAKHGGPPYHESDEAMGMILLAWKNKHIRAGTKTEADFANFDILKTFAAKKPKKGKTAREKAMLESLKRSIEEAEKKLDAHLAAKAKKEEEDRVAEAEKEAEKKRKRTEKRKAEKMRARERKEAQNVGKEGEGDEAVDADGEEGA